MKSLKKEALAVLGLVISPDVGLVISAALLVMIFIAAAMNRPKRFAARFVNNGDHRLD
jgi:hypothetical protein